MPQVPHAYYGGSVADFQKATPDEIIGALTKNSEFDIDTTQRDAWLGEIEILKEELQRFDGRVLLEFNVPRIGSRLDAVLISGPVIFVIEFKVGQAKVNQTDLNQVWDYALDLKNFHKASHAAFIIPILIATNAHEVEPILSTPNADGVFPPVPCSCSSLHKLIKQGLSASSGTPINQKDWEISSYQPTPTIIEAAQRLYSRHSVESIARNDAGARNLNVTSQRIEELVNQASKNSQKIIVFVTGVPGAGKTLVGLNIATKKRDETQPTHAVFLSGNGPLVEVLREALTRDEVLRRRKEVKKVRKGEVMQKVKAFIQNVHHFRSDGLRDPNAPADHVVIFDEAQRAWNREMTASFMKRKKGVPNFTQSEPEFLISYLDRHKDWAVVICLVGGGQEIYDGEAGISAWLDAMKTMFSSWHVYVSPELVDSEYAAGHALDELATRPNVVRDKSLHLAVSMRSFRAENVSGFVKAVLDCDRQAASQSFEMLRARYPLTVTRDLKIAKQWVRDHARGSERFGLVASSEAQRLKPHAIDIRVDVNPIHYFLNNAEDTRSSFYMEDAATEFQVQGLELDWVCMSWDADLRFSKSGWNHHSFKGSKWTSIHNLANQQYLKNAYRVLLTRARQGMVIFIPPGDSGDDTRKPAFYDSTFNYLVDIGIPQL